MSPARRRRVVVPVKVRLRGLPDAAALAALEEAVARQVARRLDRAREVLAGGSPALAGAVERVVRDGAREGWDASRLEGGAAPVSSRSLAARTPLRYRVPSYNGGGAPTGLPVHPTQSRLTKILISADRGQMLVFRMGEQPWSFTVTTENLPAGEFVWAWKDGRHRLSLSDKPVTVINFRGSKKDLKAFARSLRAQGGTVPVRITRTAGEGKAGEPAGDTASGEAAREGEAGEVSLGGKKDEGGEAAHPIEADLAVFAENPDLAVLLLELLERFAGLALPPATAAGGLAVEALTRLVAGNVEAQLVVRFVAQGWNEWRRAGGGDLSAFAVLIETLLTQWKRGNYNARRNFLEISRDAAGFGIFRRGTPFKYYDELGQPLPSIGGGFMDDGYRAAAPPSAAVKITISDPVLLGILRAVQQSVVDEPLNVYLAAKAYVDNGDLLWPAVRDGWDIWDDVEEELQRQFPVLIGFLAGHLVALALQRSGHPAATALGVAIEGVLWAAGKMLQIVFVGQLLVMAYRAGAELSLVRRPEPGQPLDRLSERHLRAAISHIRQLLTAALAAGLTAGVLQAAKQTAMILPPPGGMGPPTGLALATAGGPRAPLRVPARAASTTGGPPPRMPGFGPAPVAMSSTPDGGFGGGPPGSGSPGSGRGSGGTPGGRSAGRKRGTGRRTIVRPPAASSGSPGPPTPAKPAAKPAPAPERSKTGARLEREELAYHRATRAPESAGYYSRTRARFSTLVDAMHRYAKREMGKKRADPFDKIDDSVLNRTAHEVIQETPRLRAWWEGRSRSIAEQLSRINQELRDGSNRGGARRVLEVRKTKLEETLQEMTAFERGKVGDKEPDLVEFFPQDKRIIITDITFKVFDPMHNFKTRFYVEVMKKITGWEEVYGLEFRDVKGQRVIE